MFDADDVPDRVIIRNGARSKTSALDFIEEDEEEVNHSDNSSLLEKL